MKFSIITPTYNSEKYLEDTIKSVLSQKGDFEIEYIIVDGVSTDKTLDIIKRYEKLLSGNKYPIKCNRVSLKWVSEKDNGMYSAINKGFSMATGDIYAWINSDDVYLPKAFETVHKILKKYPRIDWVKGITLITDENLKTVKTNPCYIYNQNWIRDGIYGRNAYFIHQDSVFWRGDLWRTAQGISEQYKLAGDYYLWKQFAKYSSLWSINQPLSCFRKRENQLSENMTEYRKEQALISSEKKDFETKIIKTFFWLKTKTDKLSSKIALFLYNVLFLERNRYYISIDKISEPIIRKAASFIA